MMLELVIIIIIIIFKSPVHRHTYNEKYVIYKLLLNILFIFKFIGITLFKALRNAKNVTMKYLSYEEARRIFSLVLPRYLIFFICLMIMLLIILRTEENNLS